MRYPVQATVHFMPETGQWSISATDLWWVHRIPSFFGADYSGQGNLTKLLQLLANSLAIKAIAEVPVTPTSFKSKHYNIIISPEDFSTCSLAVRYDIIGIYRPAWADLWKAVLNRVQYDPQFHVNGYSRDECLKAFQNLSRFYPADWVRKRYAEALDKDVAAARPWLEIEHNYDRWFPVAHIVRVFNGFSCKDPAFNALVSLGLELPNLAKFPRAKTMLEKIGTAGFLFQSLTASHFSRVGELNEVERPSGGTQDDLVVQRDGKQVSLEIKTVLSNRFSAQWLNIEIKDKAAKLPRKPDYPVTMLVFILELGKSSAEIEVLVKNKTKHLPMGEMVASIQASVVHHPKIDAIVFASFVVDTLGGAPFLMQVSTIHNPSSLNPVDQSMLDPIFDNDRPRSVGRFTLPHLMVYVMGPVADDLR